MLKRLMILVLLFSGLNSGAQEATAIAGPYGLYIYCGNALPKKGPYVIRRSEAGKNSWSVVGTASFPADSAQFFSAYAEAAALNEAAPLLNETEKPEIWRRAMKSTTIDSTGIYAGSPAFRQALGNVFYDTTAVSGKIYDYRISRNDPQGKPTEITISKAVFNPSVSSMVLKALYAEPYEDKVVLRYYNTAGPLPARVKLYRQYYLQDEYREVPAGYNMVTEGPNQTFLLTDPNVKKGLVYNYYAVPFDPFGNPGKPSDTTRLANLVQAAVPAVERLKAISVEKEHAIKLSWKYAPVKFLKSVNIYRSETYDTARYELVGTAAAKDTTFLDRKVEAVKTYYYFIKLNGDRSSGVASARVPGMLKADRKATAPSGLEAGRSAGGIVLTWNRPEKATRGYYIYRSENDTLHMKQVSGFIPISGKVTETYTDTLRSKIQQTVYYTVRAENTSYDRSPRAEIVSVSVSATRFDQSPVTLRAKTSGKAVMLYWPASQSQLGDIKGYRLRRTTTRGDTASGRSLLNRTLLAPLQNYFEDTTAVQGQSYTYQLEILRQTGNATASVTYTTEKPEILSPGGIIGSRNGQIVHIGWDASGQENVTGYKIYQLDADGNPKLLSTVTGKEKSSYQYSNAGNEKVILTVVAVGKDDLESDPGNWITIM